MNLLNEDMGTAGFRVKYENSPAVIEAAIDIIGRISRTAMVIDVSWIQLLTDNQVGAIIFRVIEFRYFVIPAIKRICKEDINNICTSTQKRSENILPLF